MTSPSAINWTDKDVFTFILVKKIVTDWLIDWPRERPGWDSRNELINMSHFWVNFLTFQTLPRLLLSASFHFIKTKIVFKYLVSIFSSEPSSLVWRENSQPAWWLTAVATFSATRSVLTPLISGRSTIYISKGQKSTWNTAFYQREREGGFIYHIWSLKSVLCCTVFGNFLGRFELKLDRLENV